MSLDMTPAQQKRISGLRADEILIDEWRLGAILLTAVRCCCTSSAHSNMDGEWTGSHHECGSIRSQYVIETDGRVRHRLSDGRLGPWAVGEVWLD